MAAQNQVNQQLVIAAPNKIDGLVPFNGVPSKTFWKDWGNMFKAKCGNIMESGHSIGALINATDAAAGRPLRNKRLHALIVANISGPLVQEFSEAPFVENGMETWNYLVQEYYVRPTPAEVNQMEQNWIRYTWETTIHKSEWEHGPGRWMAYLKDKNYERDPQQRKSESQIATQYLVGMHSRMKDLADEVLQDPDNFKNGILLSPVNYPAAWPVTALQGAAHPNAGQLDCMKVERFFATKWSAMIASGTYTLPPFSSARSSNSEATHNMGDVRDEFSSLLVDSDDAAQVRQVDNQPVAAGTINWWIRCRRCAGFGHYPAICPTKPDAVPRYLIWQMLAIQPEQFLLQNTSGYNRGIGKGNYGRGGYGRGKGGYGKGAKGLKGKGLKGKGDKGKGKGANSADIDTDSYGHDESQTDANYVDGGQDNGEEDEWNEWDDEAYEAFSAQVLWGQ